jgi:tRNA threonylcarbamoyl adenosine modification protein YeaZ
VTSPTFVLVKTYTAGRFPVVHVDVYRLNRLQDVLDLGDDVFAPDAVTFVEWGDAVASLLPEDRFDIEIVHAGDPDDVERRIRLQGHGSWAPGWRPWRPRARPGRTPEPVLSSRSRRPPRVPPSRSSTRTGGRTGGLGVPRRHGEFLAPAIAFCLEQSGRTAADVSGVAVGLGPGLYTGLRVGIATAQAFAAALASCRSVGMCGLDVLAFQARHVRRLICATLDARRGEVFWAFYRNAPGGVQRQATSASGAPTNSPRNSSPPARTAWSSATAASVRPGPRGRPHRPTWPDAPGPRRGRPRRARGPALRP